MNLKPFLQYVTSGTDLSPMWRGLKSLRQENVGTAQLLVDVQVNHEMGIVLLDGQVMASIALISINHALPSPWRPEFGLGCLSATRVSDSYRAV